MANVHGFIYTVEKRSKTMEEHEDMATFDGDKSIIGISTKRAKNFEKYKRGEISKEEYDQLAEEIRKNARNDRV